MLGLNCEDCLLSEPGITKFFTGNKRFVLLIRYTGNGKSGGESLKGLILCGGKGTRLRPFTYSSAKQLLPVANKPVVFYAIESLKEAGIKEVAIIVGDTEEEVKKVLGDGSRWDLCFTYIRQEKPKGLAHAAKIAENYMGDQPFVMVLGDNLIMESVKGIVEHFKNTCADCTVLLAPVSHPQRYGIAEIEGDRIIRLVEKPKDPPSNYGIIGIYVFNSKVFRAIDRIKPSWRGELEITDAIMQMVEDGDRVNYLLNKGWWKDVGKPEDLLEANMKVLSKIKGRLNGVIDKYSVVIGEAVIEEGATVKGSIIRGPVVIGKGAEIENSYIGPYTSVGEGSSLTGCEVENSVILEGCILENISTRIDTSIIGKGSVVRKRELPRSMSIWIGRDSRMEIF